METSGGARTTHTDSLGRFRLGGLEAGAARVIVGDPESPLLTRQAVRVESPRTSVGELLLPRLGSLLVEVVDELDRPVSGAKVVGLGDRGGALRGESDVDGRLLGEQLPAGRYRVFASLPGSGRGNQAIVLDPRVRAELRIVLLQGPGHERDGYP